MARRKGNKGLLLAGLAAGAYAYFKKPENREKATVAFNNAKEKVNSYMESQNLESQNRENAAKETERKTDITDMRKNKMTNEGGLAGAQYYNEDAPEDTENDDFKLSSNDISEEKAENTKTIAPETRLNTDNL
ncbi:hypothetical protein ACTL32_15035 [Planococcus sp. FY231025]|uniref:hypothetical protein n=1 Tax=Planococcus sp. FY231025 TaxID=3455699 RepID=UPI003F90FA3C